MKQKILAIGSADIYINMAMAQLPASGESVSDDGSVTVINGGKASNTAVALSRLEAKALLCARVGDDAYGKRLARLYKESRIDISYLEIDSSLRTGVTVTINEKDSESRKILYRGANTNITPEDALRSMSCEPEAIYIDLELSFAIAETIIKYASRHSIPVFFNASPFDRDHPMSELPPVDIFCINETDAIEFAGFAPLNSDMALRIAIQLQKHVNANYYVIRMGEKGTFIYDGKHYHIVSSHIVRSVDSSASDEVFSAAFLLEYIRNGKNIIPACKYANAAVALTVQKSGTTASMPYHDEVMEFIAKKSF